MSLNIKYIKNNGSSKDERIIFDVLENCDVWKYLVFDTTYNEASAVSNKLRHHYWFPDQEVEAWDLVVLYTKKGKDTYKNNASGNKTWFFYWWLEKAIINNQKDCILLVKAESWMSKGTSIIRPRKLQS